MNGGSSAARPVALPLTGPTSCFVGRIRQRRHPAGRPVALPLTGSTGCFVGRIRQRRHPATQ